MKKWVVISISSVLVVGLAVMGVLYGLSYLIALLFMLVIIMYIIKMGFGTDGEPAGFQLATVSTVIGGLILTSTGGICERPTW